MFRADQGGACADLVSKPKSMHRRSHRESPRIFFRYLPEFGEKFGRRAVKTNSAADAFRLC